MSVCLHVCTYACMLSYRHMYGPQGFWGSGEKGFLFSESLEALVIIFMGLGSKLMVLRDLGALQKVKNEFINLTLKEMPPFCLIKKNYLASGVGVRAVASPDLTCKIQM